MRRLDRRIALLLALVAAASAAGCWRASEITRERLEQSLAAGDPRVLVIPLNVAVALEPGLDAAVEPVQQEILAQLSAQGARVSFLAVEDARALWRDTIAAVRNLERNAASLEVVAGTFVRALRDEVSFDLLLMPSLGYREARVERAYASWDGVSRSLTARRQEWSLSDRIPAFSLHVQVYTPDGRLWYQRWGGLDLVYQSDLEEDPELSADELQESREAIREGVSIALRRKAD